MNLKGTEFQLKVWNYLKKIPKGKVKTYLEVAKAIGKPKAFRAICIKPASRRKRCIKLLAKKRILKKSKLYMIIL